MATICRCPEDEKRNGDRCGKSSAACRKGGEDIYDCLEECYGYREARFDDQNPRPGRGGDKAGPKTNLSDREAEILSDFMDETGLPRTEALRAIQSFGKADGIDFKTLSEARENFGWARYSRGLDEGGKRTWAEWGEKGKGRKLVAEHAYRTFPDGTLKAGATTRDLWNPGPNHPSRKQSAFDK